MPVLRKVVSAGQDVTFCPRSTVPRKGDFGKGARWVLSSRFLSECAYRREFGWVFCVRARKRISAKSRAFGCKSWCTIRGRFARCALHLVVAKPVCINIEHYQAVP